MQTEYKYLGETTSQAVQTNTNGIQTSTDEYRRSTKTRGERHPRRYKRVQAEYKRVQTSGKHMPFLNLALVEEDGGGRRRRRRRMRRIEALTDRSWKHMAFSKFALVGAILLSLIRLRTVSSYDTDSQEKQGNSCVFCQE